MSPPVVVGLWFTGVLWRGEAGGAVSSSALLTVEDRRQAAQGGLFLSCRFCGKRGTGTEGEGERLQGVLRRSRVVV
ncbi:hypothetical protein EYF80_000832 [Liparis tanakae]|uniref:Uncharacterized protein n=1 Tax=Liparis tanakae TaxID=230148 RepID=A0A4Z2JGT3_9TELE|nr:hypothetical protein EYF80_000832 [Liparis tanakae]